MPTEQQDRDDLLRRRSRFERQFFPRYEKTYRRLVAEGQVLVLDAGSGRFEPLARQESAVPAAAAPIEVDAGHWARFGSGAQANAAGGPQRVQRTTKSMTMAPGSRLRYSIATRSP